MYVLAVRETQGLEHPWDHMDDHHEHGAGHEEAEDEDEDEE